MIIDNHVPNSVVEPPGLLEFFVQLVYFVENLQIRSHGYVHLFEPKLFFFYNGAGSVESLVNFMSNSATSPFSGNLEKKPRLILEALANQAEFGAENIAVPAERIWVLGSWTASNFSKFSPPVKLELASDKSTSTYQLQRTTSDALFIVELRISRDNERKYATISKVLELNLSSIIEIDTTGASVLLTLLSDFDKGQKDLTLKLIFKTPEQAQIVSRVFTLELGPFRQQPKVGFISFVGDAAINLFNQILGIVALLGHSVMVSSVALIAPKKFRFSEFMTQLHSVCLMAIGVVALVTFLIGLVVAYLFSLQAAQYGANIFIVDGVGQAMLRELSPILVAVVVAGRTGSAFTAQIGAMLMNEELDALEMLGLSTNSVVVVPRILALVLAMPILVFVGDCVGMFGAMLIAKGYLDISIPFFLDRFLQVIPVKAYLIGVVKAPVFGLVVGLIACYMGLSVERNAQSLGIRTTSTVVQSIVAVIILNAIFAIVCAKAGW